MGPGAGGIEPERGKRGEKKSAGPGKGRAQNEKSSNLEGEGKGMLGGKVIEHTQTRHLWGS